MRLELQRWESQTLRPILEDWRREIEAYLDEKSQRFCIQVEKVQGELYQAGIPATGQHDEQITKRWSAPLGFVNLVIDRGLTVGTNDLVVYSFSLISGRSIERSLKKQIGQSLKKELEEHIEGTAEEIAERIDKQVRGLITRMEQALGACLDGAREQVEAVLRDKRSGATKIQERKRLLVEIAAETAETDAILRQIIFEMAGA